jgi:hypothetical protein
MVYESFGSLWLIETLKYLRPLTETMKAPLAVPLAILTVLLASLAFPTATAYTGSWSITVMDGFGQPVAPDGLDGGANFTVQVKIGEVLTDGARYLIITTSKTNASSPMYRKSLGFYTTTYNGTQLINTTLSLKTFFSDINPTGDYMHIWVERVGGTIEADAGNVIIKADIQRLLDQQNQFFLTYMQGIQRDFANQIFFLSREVQQLTNYVIALALLAVFIGLFSARDIIRKNTKAAKEAEKNRTMTEAWLKVYIAERFGPIDRAQLRLDKAAEEARNGTQETGGR